MSGRAHHLVSSYDAIAVEGLNVAGMLRTKMFSHRMASQRWAAFDHILERGEFCRCSGWLWCRWCGLARALGWCVWWGGVGVRLFGVVRGDVVALLGAAASSGLFEVVYDGCHERGERVGCYRPRFGVIGASGQRPCESPLRGHRPWDGSCQLAVSVLASRDGSALWSSTRPR